jgi:hypothetical protein
LRQCELCLSFHQNLSTKHILNNDFNIVLEKVAGAQNLLRVQQAELEMDEDVLTTTSPRAQGTAQAARPTGPPPVLIY